MRKLSKIIGALCIGLIGLASFNPPVTNAQTSENSLILKLNNAYVLYSDQQLPYSDKSNRTLIPIRLISEVMGANVVWNNVDRKVTISRDHVKLEVILGQKTAIVNNKEVPMDTIAAIKNNTVMVPARFISDALGIKIDYNKNSNVVSMTDEAFFSADNLKGINEMERINVDYQGTLIPQDITIKIDSKGSNNKLSVKLLNNSSTSITKGQLNRNMIFYSGNSNIAFIGTRGMISPDGTTGYNKADIGAGKVYTDEMSWEDSIFLNGKPIKYIFCNYFVTAS